MKLVRIIISIAIANVLLVTGLALFSSSNPKTPVKNSATGEQCIITISGIKYDVQPLRSTHSGGDVFVCGTDMTKAFFGQHDQSLLNGTMQKYRLP